MHKKWIWIVWPLLLTIAGCAVNDKGFVCTHYFESESSYLLTQESWGGYLSTRKADGGLTLGHAERILIYSKSINNSGLSIDELLKKLTGSGFEKEIEAKDVNLNDQQPYAWIENNQGIMFHVNSLKTGLSIGMESRNVIKIPADFDGVFILHYLGDGKIVTAIYETSKKH